MFNIGSVLGDDGGPSVIDVRAVTYKGPRQPQGGPAKDRRKPFALAVDEAELLRIFTRTIF